MIITQKLGVLYQFFPRNTRIITGFSPFTGRRPYDAVPVCLAGRLPYQRLFFFLRMLPVQLTVPASSAR